MSFVKLLPTLFSKNTESPSLQVKLLFFYLHISQTCPTLTQTRVNATVTGYLTQFVKSTTEEEPRWFLRSYNSNLLFPLSSSHSILLRFSSKIIEESVFFFLFETLFVSAPRVFAQTVARREWHWPFRSSLIPICCAIDAIRCVNQRDNGTAEMDTG